MKHFTDCLIQRIEELNNPTVMGLDPQIDQLPQELLDYFKIESYEKLKSSLHFNLTSSPALSLTCEAIWEFNKALIDETWDIIPAIKPQFAYYEMYGLPGIKLLLKTISYAKKKNMLVIADAKRNDIGTTAAAYAKGILGQTALIDESLETLMGADAITLNGYLGIDGIAPFIEWGKKAGKGMFILVRTSNPSAGDFQDLELASGEKVYEKVAQKINLWGEDTIGKSGYSLVGAVVGATWPEQAKALRQQMPHSLILVPGYGAQGGGAEMAAVNFDAKSRGAIVNASRSLMYAYKDSPDLASSQFAKATRQEALAMKDNLNRVLLR